jgi:predicted nucleic acid-binding Zn ribbon protein
MEREGRTRERVAVSDPGIRGGWPVRLGDVLKPALERIGPAGVWTEAKLRKVWLDVVGEQVAASANVRRLRGKVLEVEVSSDTWATELTYLSAAIIEKLNAKLGTGTVDRMSVSRRRKQR